MTKNEKIKNLIDSCNSIIYVDNPSVEKTCDDGEKENSRKYSREVVLNYLANKCQEIYKLKDYYLRLIDWEAVNFIGNAVQRDTDGGILTLEKNLNILKTKLVIK